METALINEMRMERKLLNREQQEVLSLLKEIDTICRKHQITYYLSPRLTLCAVTGKPFPMSPLAGAVLVKMADMEKLRKILEAELPEGRAVESMKNNKRFPGLFLRYENKNTLCFRLYEGRNYLYPGIGIDIIPLRAKSTSKKVRSWDQRMEVGWVQMCDNARYELDFYKFFCGWMMRILSLGGRERLGQKVYDRLCRNQDSTDAEKYVLRWNRNNSYTYPAEIFREAKDVLLEGESFLIPGDEKRYLKETFGKNYERHSFNDNLSGMSMMVSARIGCEDFLREAGPMKKLIKGRRRLFVADAWVYQHCKVYFDQCWDYAQACASRRELSTFYDGQKEYIRNLWENRDFVRLDAAFRPYKKMVRCCMETGDRFETDEEIRSIFLEYLRESGNVKLLKQMGQIGG